MDSGCVRVEFAIDLNCETFEVRLCSEFVPYMMLSKKFLKLLV